MYTDSTAYTDSLYRPPSCVRTGIRTHGIGPRRYTDSLYRGALYTGSLYTGALYTGALYTGSLYRTHCIGLTVSDSLYRTHYIGLTMQGALYTGSLYRTHYAGARCIRARCIAGPLYTDPLFTFRRYIGPLWLSRSVWGLQCGIAVFLGAIYWATVNWAPMC